MWYGEYIHKLDDKDRFILPAKFREKIKTLKEKKFFITRGLDGCLFLVPQEAWKRLEDKLRSLPFTKKQSRTFNRLYFSGASEIDIDTQGRIILPEYLKEFARIQREIVIIGVADRIEIWGKEGWDRFYQESKKRFEEMAENLFEE
ncbi:MAG: division/cell wall cluster transcriptional repressor MraZ [Candidatus Omnitrophica bacterium]|nr:division/cell wall cluster transcriptional repressor MraZ [Candidatus Omnitrophota bacterium]